MTELIQIAGICGIIGMLYKISRELGGVSVLLKEHDRRIGKIEDGRE